MPEQSTIPDPLEDDLRRSIEAINRGDYNATLASWASDAILDLSPIGMDLVETSPRGHEAIRKLWEEVAATFADFEIEVEELLDLGNGVTLSVFSQRGKPRGSNALVEMRYAGVAQRKDELVERPTLYPDIDEARAAAERLAHERGQAVSKESTTPDLEQAIRRFVEAIDRRDVNTIMASFAPDLVWDTSRMGLVPAFTGREAVRRVLEDWRRAYEDFEQVSRQYHDLGNGVGLMAVVYRGRPRGASRFLELRVADVVVWEDGVIRRMTTYTDINEGRAAAERLAEERS